GTRIRQQRDTRLKIIRVSLSGLSVDLRERSSSTPAQTAPGLFRQNGVVIPKLDHLAKMTGYIAGSVFHVVRFLATNEKVFPIPSIRFIEIGHKTNFSSITIPFLNIFQEQLLIVINIS